VAARGDEKKVVRVSQWTKPSNELRKFFNHDPARWEEFRKRYRQELRSGNAQSMLRKLAELAVKNTVTLVYGAKDETHNQAVVLREVLERMTRIGLDEGKESRGTSWN
jgi:uncharacterized protein YeaO (DUF488 family)